MSCMAQMSTYDFKVILEPEPDGGRKPMDLLLAIGGAMSFRITLKTTLNRASYFCSNAFSFRTNSACAMTSLRSRTKARMI